MTDMVTPNRHQYASPVAFAASMREEPIHPPEITRIDGATHYEVGVAYEEMGLPEDAIYEFELAAEDPAFRLSSWRSVGRLHHAQRRWDQAQHAYEHALASTAEAGGQAHEVRQALELVQSRTPLPSAVAQKPATPANEALLDEHDVEQAFDDLFG